MLCGAWWRCWVHTFRAASARCIGLEICEKSVEVSEQALHIVILLVLLQLKSLFQHLQSFSTMHVLPEHDRLHVYGLQDVHCMKWRPKVCSTSMQSV